MANYPDSRITRQLLVPNKTAEKERECVRILVLEKTSVYGIQPYTYSTREYTVPTT